MKVLDDFFIPKSDVSFERYLFRQIAQEMSETVDQFVCRFCQRAASCDFRDNQDDYIRDQVIDKCHGRFRPGRARETNQVVGGDDGEQFTRPVQQSPEYAFLVEQCIYQVKQDSGVGNSDHRRSGFSRCPYRFRSYL